MSYFKFRNPKIRILEHRQIWIFYTKNYKENQKKKNKFIAPTHQTKSKTLENRGKISGGSKFWFAGKLKISKKRIMIKLIQSVSPGF